MSSQNKPSAIVLFGHGARDERWKEPFIKIKELIQTESPHQRVELAFLELMEPNLEAAISQLIDSGIQSIKVVPVFLGQGGHIRKDFPALLENGFFLTSQGNCHLMGTSGGQKDQKLRCGG